MWAPPVSWRSGEEFDLEPRRYVLVTLHRPALVDSPELLRATMRALVRVGAAPAGRLPGAPADAGAPERARHRARLRAPRRPAALRALPLARGRGRGRRDRLGRCPGGDDRARRPVLHAAGQHGAADHGQPRHEHAARARPGPAARDPRAPEDAPPHADAAALGRARRRACRDRGRGVLRAGGESRPRGDPTSRDASRAPQPGRPDNDGRRHGLDPSGPRPARRLLEGDRAGLRPGCLGRSSRSSSPGCSSRPTTGSRRW